MRWSGCCSTGDSVSRTDPVYLVQESGDVYCSYQRIGSLVTLAMNNVSSNATLGALPEGFRPAALVVGTGYVRGTNYVGQILIETDGKVSTWCSRSDNYFAGCVTFPVA